MRRMCVSALIILWVSASAWAGSSSDAPVRACEISMAAWCIYGSNVVIENRPSGRAGFHARWTIYAEHWKDLPFIVFEPIGCRQSVSDEIRLRKVTPQYRWEGKDWSQFVVALQSEGNCDLEVLTPTRDRDPAGTAFSSALGLIQACRTEKCEGAPIGQVLLPGLHRD